MDEGLERLRRSLVMCDDNGPATALTNRTAMQLIARVQRLEELHSGVADLLQQNSPVPRQNVQLRRFCSQLAKLLATSRSQQS